MKAALHLPRSGWTWKAQIACAAALFGLVACGPKTAKPPEQANNAISGLNCAAAASDIEKIVCANPDLTAKEQEATAALNAAAADISEESRALLLRSEGDWRRYVDEYCLGVASPGGSLDPELLKGCLAEEYGSRIEALKNTVQIVDGEKFVQIEEFRARRGDFGALANVVRQRVAVLRQDGGASGAAWNAANVKPQSVGNWAEEDFEEEIAQKLTLVSKSFVGAVETRFVMGVGAAHPTASQKSINKVIENGAARPLAAQDLFKPNSGWQEALAEIGLNGLKEQSEGEAIDAAAVKKVAANPDNWVVRPNGLGLFFGQYSVASYAFGEHEILAPWADLKPYLQPVTPFPTDGSAKAPPQAAPK